jgi:subtilisin family serine protease
MPRIRILTATLVVLTLLLSALAAPASAASGKRSYIVVLRSGGVGPATAARQARKGGASVEHVYRHTIKGYAAKLSDADVAALRADPDVKFVVRDGIAHATKATTRRGPQGQGKKNRTSYSFPSWGLDRIDQRDLPLSSSYYDSPTKGAGVTAYVVDTGIRISHTQFGGRAVYGRDTVDGDSVASDCNGHGTHVAGTIGGSTYGVAKRVNLVAVRVLNCAGSGTWSGVIAGIDWAAGDHASGTPAVMNLSLGGGANQAVDDAIGRAVADGITVVVAAGNSSANACNYSPARAPSALTIGATTSTDARASYSNIGTCLDLFAPGSSITSAWSTGDNATNTISGTSMASPHVAGVAALYLGGHPAASPSSVGSNVISLATTGHVSNAGSGSPNRLLYTNY